MFLSICDRNNDLNIEDINHCGLNNSQMNSSIIHVCSMFNQ